MTSSRYRLVFDARGPLRSAAFATEARIFETTYGVSYPDHVAEFRPYAAASVFAVVHDRDDEVVGVMRLIVPGPAGLKTLAEAGGPPWHIDGLRSARAVGVDPERTWDVATVGVVRGVGRNRGTITAALYHALTVGTQRNNIRSLLMTIDERVRSILGMTGLFMAPLPGAKPGPFCGSPASTTVYCHCREFLATQRRVNPEAHRMIALGIGLDDIAVPPREAFSLGAVPTHAPLGIDAVTAAEFGSADRTDVSAAAPAI